MLTQELACGSPSLNHVEEPRRDSSLSIDFSQQQHGHGREGRRLKDHGVTCITETKTQTDILIGSFGLRTWSSYILFSYCNLKGEELQNFLVEWGVLLIKYE